MRKQWLVLVALGAGAAAHADDGVTLYGLANPGLTWSSNANGASRYLLDSGAMSGNRWGLAGRESLGGGVSTVFTLEGGYNVANGAIGQNGTFFGRQVFVGVESPYGAMTLGRQYSPAAQLVGPFESGDDWAAVGGLYGAHPGNLDQLDPQNRINNAIKYTSPLYRGLKFSTLYSLGGVAGATGMNRILSLAARYDHGPLAAGLAYLYADDPNHAFFGSTADASATGNNITGPVLSGYASAGSQQIFSAGMAYTIGWFTFGSQYSNTRFNDLGTNTVAGLTESEQAYRGSVFFNTGELNLKVQPAANLLLAAAVHYTRASSVDGRDGAQYRQINLGVDYFLSKRTDLYAVAILQRASGVDSTGRAAVAQIGAIASSNSRQALVTTGIRHKF